MIKIVAIIQLLTIAIDWFYLYFICSIIGFTRKQSISTWKVHLIYVIYTILIYFYMKFTTNRELPIPMLLINTFLLVIIYSYLKLIFEINLRQTAIVLSIFILINIVSALSITIIYKYVNSQELLSLLATILMFLLTINLKSYIIKAYVNLEQLLTKINQFKFVIMQYFMTIVAMFFIASFYFDLYYKNFGLITQKHIDLIPIFLIIYTIYNVYNINNSINLSIDNILLEQQRLYEQEYSHILKDFKRLWHDYNNIMNTLSVLLTDKNISEKEKEQIIQDLFSQYKSSNIDKKYEFLKLKNPIVAGILSNKYEYAKSLGVELNVRTIEIGQLNISFSDLTEMLSILIDNAIETAFYTNPKLVEVTIYNLNNTTVIEIFNFKAYDSNGNLLKNHKSNNIGLYVVKDIVYRNKHIDYKVDDNYNYYQATLIFKY